MSTKGVALRYRKNKKIKINWHSNKTDLGSRDYPVENNDKGCFLFEKAMA